MHCVLWEQEEVYRAGFYDGVFTTGPYSGRKVEEVKAAIQTDMIDKGLAFKYQEPEKYVRLFPDRMRAVHSFVY